MKKLYLTLAVMLLSTSAHAACTVTEGSFFKNPNCNVVDDSGNVVGRPVYTGYNAPTSNSAGGKTGLFASRGNDSGNIDSSDSSKAPARTFTRNYPLGQEPRTRQEIDGVREVSRRTLRTVDNFVRSTYECTCVTIDRVKGTRTISSVEISFSTAPTTLNGDRGGNRRNGTHGPGQQH